ncbi:enoyl-CoA hydratase-related protein [Caenimonas aquaedulcis]|uniref:Enoyl-CoA hydratase/isomerase family protein n=1 Tax=Caenimonas aquaedulcis TaxID=2793270 RepID=A0A931MGF8_9BURK|nr:enoyl-CoA hydratase-related protein [Caenimonas aquaedulcis]MBG9388007.1 enoyl-CoA hydratase/isomerase family protein [Caenimonas aquaedulcis]
MNGTASTLFDVRDGVATLTLNEGARMNPLTDALQQGCLAALKRVREDRSIRALIVTGEGKAFCAGADLAEFGRRAAQPGASMGTYVGEMMEQTGNPIVAGLRALPVPVVCAMNGVAAGGGVGLALAADIVVAARSAYFYLPFVPALGLVPDMGASWHLPRALGRARALALTLTGDKLSAEKAVQWGLIWDCVDDAQLQAHCRQLASRLAELPAGAANEARALFAAAESSSFEEQLARERERQMELIERPAFAAGVASFGARRKPGP